MGYSPWDRKELDTTERLHFISASSSGLEASWGQVLFIAALPVP